MDNRTAPRRCSPNAGRPAVAWSRAWVAVYSALFCALVILVLARATVTPDQMEQLGLGVQLARHGHVLPVGQAMSGGGMKPGCFYQMLQGLPLLLWFDYRAPRVLMGLMALGAAWLLHAAVAAAGGRRYADTSVALFALSPWLLFFLAGAVDISFLFLPVAAHLWACQQLRQKPRRGASFALGLDLALLAQIHGSFTVLWLATLWLVWRRQIHVRWPAALAGAGLGALFLLPTAAAWHAGTLPPISPQHGHFGWGAVHGYPILKGLGFWFRMASADAGRALRDTLFFAPEARLTLGQLVATLAWVAATASILVSMWAARWFFFVQPRRESTDGLQWLRTYAATCFWCLLISCAISPVDIQAWHVLTASVAAGLPVAAWCSHGLANRPARIGVLAFSLAARVAFVLVLVAGHSSFRRVWPAPPDVAPLLPRAMRMPATAPAPVEEHERVSSPSS